MTASYDDIARRAFEIWERNGRPEGRDQEHWDQAEKEVSEQMTRKPAQRNSGSPPAAPETETEVYKAPGKKSRSRVAV